MVREYINGQMVVRTTATGKTTRCMDTENLHIQMVASMKEIMLTIKRRDKVDIAGPMDEAMKEAG